MKQDKLVTAVRLILTTSASNRQIGRDVDLAYNTIRRYRMLLMEHALTLEDVEGLSEPARQTLFNRRGAALDEKRIPDWPHIQRELQRKGVTRTLLWLEYRDEDPDTAYELSRFNDLYRAWAGTQALSMRQQYDPGERGWVDFSGTLMAWVDPGTGEQHKAEIFVAAAGVAGLLFATAVPSQRIEHWVEAHCRWYAFIGGVPRITVPDNLKSAVTKAGSEPVLNASYLAMADHYGTVILPARSRRPKDKSLAEGGVLVFLRWVIARLRNRVFHSLDELNVAIAECLELINDRTMRRYRQSRRERFEQIDRPALLPLPARYEFGEWIGPVRVPPDYHVPVRGHYYSVPYRLVQQQIHARCSQSVIEIFNQNKRVASHARSEVTGGKTTDRSHLPENHLAWADHTPERYLGWAKGVGDGALTVVQSLLDAARQPAAALNACGNLQKVAYKHGAERFELACSRALAIKSPTVKSIRSILQNGLERHEAISALASPLPSHGNVRGPNYYSTSKVTRVD
ncbi:IS21 family transposase [Stenotrophomonas maltophilia]|uniref:IS21 family transposase n=1 Tax=Stenotrophomonas maltophilia TaxID=40324 RepID=UPI0012FDECD4|nr:IS21 family transposase [Stenotrophomonas maltophilia]HDS1145116.1 IS21 family transposase [Stenotrophomonas maltophilia]HDS1159986.1 IS21 family transposase [Stenotrophomonas maltophilia]